MKNKLVKWLKSLKFKIMTKKTWDKLSNDIVVCYINALRARGITPKLKDVESIKKALRDSL